MATKPMRPECSDVEYGVVIKTVNEGIKKLHALRSMRSQQRRQFAADLAFVGLSFRTGYLVDVVAPQDPVQVFAQLISDLRLACSEFDAVTHVYEPTSEQSFFVNIPMLLKRCHADESDYTCGVSFVGLGRDGSFRVLPGPPPDLIATLSSLVGTTASTTFLPPSITLPPGLAREISIPLAAVLLDYPIAYFPETLDHPFLSDVLLDVYECILILEGVTSHTLLKFSCPAKLAVQHSDISSPSHISASLAQKIGARIVKFTTSVDLRVLHTTSAFDRVAL